MIYYLPKTIFMLHYATVIALPSITLLNCFLPVLLICNVNYGKTISYLLVFTYLLGATFQISKISKTVWLIIKLNFSRWWNHPLSSLDPDTSVPYVNEKSSCRDAIAAMGSHHNVCLVVDDNGYDSY